MNISEFAKLARETPVHGELGESSLKFCELVLVFAMLPGMVPLYPCLLFTPVTLWREISVIIVFLPVNPWRNTNACHRPRPVNSPSDGMSKTNQYM
jgi:hypothetical protein